MMSGVPVEQAVRGVIFASGLKREVFTAGNDIKELYAPQTSKSRCGQQSARAWCLLGASFCAHPLCSFRGHFVACRYREFWVTSNVFLARLYRSPLVTLAAIKGACPAGGCCLSLCCDVRIMTDQVCTSIRDSSSKTPCSSSGLMMLCL